MSTLYSRIYWNSWPSLQQLYWHGILYGRGQKSSIWLKPSRLPAFSDFAIIFIYVNNGFLCIFKNTDQNNICVSCILKAKTEKKIRKKLINPQKKAFLSFEKKTVKKCFFIFFFCFSFLIWFVLALKTIDAQMLFWSVFLKTHKKTVINRQKRPKWRFWQSITFLCVFKNTDQKNICASIVFKAESKPKHKEKFLWGVFFKN